MKCPHCGLAIPSKPKGNTGEAKYREDVNRAESAIAVLSRVPYPELWEASQLESARLQAAIASPARLYAIYRRADKKTPVAYGMEEAQ
jgi:hypothetical protein